MRGTRDSTCEPDALPGDREAFWRVDLLKSWEHMAAMLAAVLCLALAGCQAQPANISEAGAATETRSESAPSEEAASGGDEVFGIGKCYTTEDMWVEYDGKRVYGVLYTPKGLAGPAPAVICSHYFGGTHADSAQYAQAMAERGYVAYAFDFCGGSAASRSTGATTECSILTEADDLSAVLDAVRGLDVVDERSVFLLGQSQGGAVSAIVAAERPADVAGLVLLYPAFVIHDEMVDRFGSADNVPETFTWWQELGRVYAVDAMNYDFYEHIGDYEGPVLIFHGTADSLVPLSYAERAAEIYVDADLEVIEGAGHGFYGSDQRHAFERTAAFVGANSK